MLLEFGLEFGYVFGDDSAVVADEVAEYVDFADRALGYAFVENLFEVGVLADRLDVERLYFPGNQIEAGEYGVDYMCHDDYFFLAIPLDAVDRVVAHETYGVEMVAILGRDDVRFGEVVDHRLEIASGYRGIAADGLDNGAKSCCGQLQTIAVEAVDGLGIQAAYHRGYFPCVA